jgi:uncharacterized membrane protein HdeD (DUF308 family)
MAMRLDVVPRHWWALGLRGLAAVLFGILAFAWPGLTLAVLVVLFGTYAVVDGVLAILSAIRSNGAHLWALLVKGIVDIVAGVAAITWPGLTALLLVYLIAVWAIGSGLLEIWSAIRLRRVINDEWAWIIGGLASVIFGCIMLATPGAGALALVWIIGIYAIIAGMTLLVLSWRVRDLERKAHARQAGASLHQPAAP